MSLTSPESVGSLDESVMSIRSHQDEVDSVDEIDEEDENEEDEFASSFCSSSSSRPPSSSRPTTSSTSSSSSSASENIQVVCRFRPESDREMSIGPATTCIEFDPRDPRNVQIHVNDEKHLSFNFDRIFQAHATQGDIFDEIGRPIVRSVLDGYNAAVLTYGQTGSGKTYTMFGRDPNLNDLSDCGLIPRMMQALFEELREKNVSGDGGGGDGSFQLRCMYVEIYLENVRDLLNPLNQHDPYNRDKKSLEIQSDSKRGMFLPKATSVPLQTMEDVFGVLRLGGKNRIVARTQANEVSSRSHAILVVTLQRRQGVGVKVSQMFLVDLAGSEKVDKTHVTGLNLTEASLINRGLLSLGQVIQALVRSNQAPSKKKKQNVFIPYRSSRLTRLLSNCIGGNSRTSLIVNVSPHEYNLQETISSLRFGDAMKQIKNETHINVELSYKELKQLLRESEEEKQQLRQVLKKLQEEMRKMREMKQFEQNIRSKDCEESFTTPRKKNNLEPISPPSATESDSSRASSASSSASVSSSSSSTTRSSPWPIVTPCPPSFTSLSPELRSLMFHFLCPISHKVMVDPVICLDGHTYSRRSITGWWKDHQHANVSPVTGLKLTSKLLIPNVVLQQQIQQYYMMRRLKKGLLEVGDDELDVEPNYMSCLPIDVLSHVCTFLDHTSLSRFGCTSSESHRVSEEERLWKLMLLRMNGSGNEFESNESTRARSYKLLFQARLLDMRSKDRAYQDRQRRRKTQQEHKGVYLQPPPPGR